MLSKSLSCFALGFWWSWRAPGVWFLTGATFGLALLVLFLPISLDSPERRIGLAIGLGVGLELLGVGAILSSCRCPSLELSRKVPLHREGFQFLVFLGAAMAILMMLLTVTIPIGIIAYVQRLPGLASTLGGCAEGLWGITLIGFGAALSTSALAISIAGLASRALSLAGFVGITMAQMLLVTGAPSHQLEQLFIHGMRHGAMFQHPIRIAAMNFGFALILLALLLGTRLSFQSRRASN